MKRDLHNSIRDSRVAAARLATAEYREPEISDALIRLCQRLGWSSSERGAFGSVVSEGDNVVVKPNLVLHKNRGSGGLRELVTNASIIGAVVKEVLKANPSRVIVGDAPIQSCAFPHLLDSTGLAKWSEQLMRDDRRFGGIVDFRRTVSVIREGVRYAESDVRPFENYVRFNLKDESLLEPITDTKRPFRVTSYDPRLMEKTHSHGNHQYLVAREVIDADVMINLPKLKTHKKAGITNALKNLVGINGNKEFLPHHRIGGSDDGGDCYPGRDRVKRALETVLDVRNSTASRKTEKVMSLVSDNLQRLTRLRGDQIGVEGSWSGNETVACMTLDLNRILLYGKSDATLGDEIQRRVVHISDAVIAGQGDGPLSPEPLQLGLLLASENAAAMDWIGAGLLGYDQQKVPLLMHAFEAFRWPIAEFSGSDVKLLSETEQVVFDRPVHHPPGWRASAA